MGSFPFITSWPHNEFEKLHAYYREEKKRQEKTFTGVLRTGVERDTDPEMAEMRMHALLFGLMQLYPINIILSWDSKNNVLNTPCTWKFTCAGKSPADLEKIFNNEFGYWYGPCLPTFDHVGQHLLVHLKFCIRRSTLENRLLKYGIEMNIVKANLDTLKSLLQFDFGERLQDIQIILRETDDDADYPNCGCCNNQNDTPDEETDDDADYPNCGCCNNQNDTPDEESDVDMSSDENQIVVPEWQRVSSPPQLGPRYEHEDYPLDVDYEEYYQYYYK